MKDHNQYQNLNSVKLEPGMIISNEPGFYRNGKFGIRIENLVLKAITTQNFLGLRLFSFLMKKDLLNLIY